MTSFAIMSLPTPTTGAALRLFAAFLAHFHLSEFAFALRFTPQDVSTRSFLLSRPYAAAMTCGVIEFAASSALMPERKASLVRGTFYLGAFMCVFGEWLRKSAMCTAGAAFTHLIQTRRRATHVLVTEGAYAYARHPGYLGWFIWALGTQLVLGNVASVAAFAVVTWVYFKRRITYEERHLRNMFSEYDAYAKRVRTWIPGIK